MVVNSLPLLLNRQQLHDSNANHGPIGIVILDDIATLYRFSDPSLHPYDPSTTTQTNQYYARDRSSELWTLSSTMKRMAYQYQVPVVVVNQVTAIPLLLREDCSSGYYYNDVNSENMPALGLVWSHCVGMRIMLRKGGVVGGGGDDKADQQKRGGAAAVPVNNSVCGRYARVLQSVNAVSGVEIKFVVEDRGVRLLL